MTINNKEVQISCELEKTKQFIIVCACKKIIKIQSVQSELKTVKKAYNNLKREKNKINQKLKTITEEKHKLQEKYDELLAKQPKSEYE